MKRTAMMYQWKFPKSVAALFAVAAVAVFSGCASVSTATDSTQRTEHWVQSVSGADGKPVKVSVVEKRSKSIETSAFAKSGKVVVLAHGAGVPGSVMFDLQVPGASGTTYSLMDYLAGQGFDVFSVDFQNYGRSDKHPCGLCVTAPVAANDVNAAIDYIMKLRGVGKVNLLGWSWGVPVTSLVAIQHPEKVRRLVMYAPPVWDSPRGKAPTDQFRAVRPQNMRQLLAQAPADAVMVDALVKENAQWGATVPNGVLLDLNTKMPLFDPKKVAAPTMVIVGSLDKVTLPAHPNLPGFFAALPNGDKQMIVVPNAGHAMTLENQRFRFYSEVAKWFNIE